MLNFNLYYLRFFTSLIAILSFFNILYSYYFNLYLNVDSYVYTLVISIIPLITIFFRKKRDIKITIYSKIVTVISGYLILPIFISLPYFLSIYNISLLDAYFESVSGFTSTGFTIFDNIKHLDESLILWRSSSQWIGGLYFLFSIILLIDIFDDNLKKTLTNFLAFNSTEIFKQSLKIFFYYTFLTFLIFTILNIFDFRSFLSFNLSMTIISSGGFLPTNSLSLLLNTQSKEIILSLVMLLSFFSLFFTYNLALYKQKGIKFIQEDIYLIFYLIVIFFTCFVFIDKKIDFSLIFLAISSSVSNIGISMDKTPTYLSFIFLILIIIGGSFFSTSSGLRFMKIYSLLKFSVNEMISHAKPKNVFINKLPFSDKIMDTSDFYKYFLTIMAFFISLIILSSILSISGLNFENAFKLSILTIMNTVNSSMTGLKDFNFEELHYITKYCLILFMIIGRVELLSLFIIFKKFFFKN
ncbi:MAG: TrkH family potassium uptake protein [Pelagibacterales bacterium]|nr:TrkH family potassium uptake protein [Pelagibacterales bacterium]